MRAIVFILFLVWLGATSVVLLTPAETVRQTSSSVRRHPSVKPHRQTVAFKTVNEDANWHLFWFFGLGVLAMLLPSKPSLAAIILIFGLLNGYSIVSELIQEHFIPGRAFEWGDLALNAVGISAGLTLSLLARRSLYSVLKCFHVAPEATQNKT